MPRMIQLLGRPSVDGIHVRGNKPWAILAYIVLAGTEVTRERLMSLLFEDAEEPAAALRWNLAQARRVLGDPGALRGKLLSLPPDHATFDVDVLVAGRWREAIDLPGLSSELLEGMPFPSCPGFETWLLGERRRLTELTEALLHEAVVSSMSIGDADGAIQLASRLVAVNPLADDNQELLVRAYATSGDAAAARRQLEVAVRLFRHELACDPAPAVFLAAQAPSAKSPAPASPARVRALLAAGEAQVGAGAVNAAVQVIRTACEEAGRLGIVTLQASAQLALGATLIGAGRALHQEGELALHRAIALAAESGEGPIAAAAYRHLAAADVLRGHYARADRYLDAVDAMGSPTPSERVEAAAIRGVSLLDQGDVVRALAVFRDGIAADPERTHRFLPLMLAHTGRAQLLAGDSAGARRHLRDSLHIAETRTWVGVTAAPLALLGHVAVVDGQLETARDLLEEAFARACQIGDPCWETWAAHGLGRHAAASGDTDAALDHLADAVARSRPQRGGHLWSHVWALSDAARLGRQAGDERAPLWRDEALAIAQRCGMRTLSTRLLDVPG